LEQLLLDLFCFILIYFDISVRIGWLMVRQAAGLGKDE
jgi:hypothetical protein